jgi:histidinol dehydrogenase
MKEFKNPNRGEWEVLCKRTEIDKIDLNNQVRTILDNVKLNGDKSLFEYAKKFDNVELKTLKISTEEIIEAERQIPDELKSAIKVAKSNIECFHNAQKEDVLEIETTAGVKCWRKSVGIEKVGLYIPGGSAPLFSTILMLGIPAKIAGCEKVILCTPPDKNGNVNPAILYAANLVGINTIYKVGGAQAIGAMAYGTQTIPQVYKIFGPGNQYVTKAKELIQQNGIAIDMPAGPSEVLVIADETCVPKYVAADLLSQAEHGSDSQVILLSDSQNVIDSVMKELASQTGLLPRKETVIGALRNSRSICFKTLDTCIEFSNQYAPEHLILAITSFDNYVDTITNAGSVFLGNYSCESAGDYASGTNHTLPTNGFARNYSGVSVDSFVKKITFQKLEKRGIQNIGPSIEIMAEAEGLQAHKNAVTLRVNDLKND